MIEKIKKLLGINSWGANALWLKNLRRNLPYALKLKVGGMIRMFSILSLPLALSIRDSPTA